jgi:hypothetical protein
MKPLHRAALALKAVSQLGFSQVALLAIYRLGLIFGVYRWMTRQPRHQETVLPFSLPWQLPDRKHILTMLGSNWQNTLREADEICDGLYRRYGASPLPLHLSAADPLLHWTQLVIHPQDGQDIKDLWEDARLGWAFILGRAYLLTCDDKYARTFWQLFEHFNRSNPPYMGPNWISAQEAGFRIIALCFARKIFASSKECSPSRISLLDSAIFANAQRIPPTLIYARAQGNNHLLSEAAGLLTAALSYPTHPQAAKWLHLGKKWFHHGLQKQIQKDGTYIQQSTNYHRLVLQLAMWVKTIGESAGLVFPTRSLDRLAAATRWLNGSMDILSGRANNLGHNDGSLLFPLGTQLRHDFRPTLQAAGLAFLSQTLLAPGEWDEFSRWMGYSPHTRYTQPFIQHDQYRLGDSRSWGSLRAVNFSHRPAHADQLHIDLWWQGTNIALDPGTYRYSAPPPWNNSLAGTGAHNTLIVCGVDQMMPAGRFLWLNWAQATGLHAKEPNAVTAEHNGYRQFGIIHRRTLSHPSSLGWKVIDRLYSSDRNEKSVYANLHWLVPDWQWQVNGTNLSLQGPLGQVRIRIYPEKNEASSSCNIHSIQLVRAGEVIYGPDDHLPVLGWYSPTYSQLDPALTFCIGFQACLPCAITTHWTLGDTNVLQNDTALPDTSR